VTELAIAGVANRASAFASADDSCVVIGIVRKAPALDQKQSRRLGAAGSESCAGGVVGRLARERLLPLADRERAAVRGSQLVGVRSDSGAKVRRH